MRRFLIAAAALLTVAVSTSSAGYLIIRVMLEGSGGGGAAGSAPTGPPAPASGRGMQPPGGSGSGASGPYGPMGSGNTGPYGPMGSGNTGPYGPMGAGGGAQPAGPAGPVDPTRSVVVVIPFTKPPVADKTFYPKTAGNAQTNPPWHLTLTTPTTHTNLFTDGQTIQFYSEAMAKPAPTKTPLTQLTERHTAWLKSRAEEPLLELVADALEYGYVTEAVKYADELLALTKAAKKSPPERVLKFAQVYGAIQPKLTAPAAKPSDAQRWREVIDSVDARVQTNRHYSLIYWDASNDEVARRFALLDDNFKAFYLWHAVHGVALEVPEKPLLAVLPRRASDLFSLSRGLDGFPIEADAFYSAEHDILVLSPERVDDAGQTFLRQNQSVVYKDGLSRAKLLLGDGPKLEGNNTPENVARMMTLALVEKYAEMESELAGISREGCRQLLFASGAMPRHVVLPRWVSNGSANFFARPKGPVYSKKTEGGFTTTTTTPPPATPGTTPPESYIMTVALTTGYGGPNYVLQRYFKDMDAAKELNPDRGQLLRNVVTDAYFNALVKDGEDVDPLPKVPVAIAIPSGGFNAGAGAGGSAGLASPGMSAGGAMQPPGMGTGGPRGGGSGSGPPPGMSMGGSMSGGAGGAGGGVGIQFEDLVAARRKKVDKLAVKTQATSWALYYYLAKVHKDGLNNYLGEMARLPRDLPIDEPTTLAVFARSFNLTTGATREAGKETFAEFGNKWMRYMAELPPAGIEVTLIEPKPAAGGGPAAPGAGGGDASGAGR